MKTKLFLPFGCSFPFGTIIGSYLPLDITDCKAGEHTSGVHLIQIPPKTKDKTVNMD
jgi:hypothetical protein